MKKPMKLQINGTFRRLNYYNDPHASTINKWRPTVETEINSELVTLISDGIKSDKDYQLALMFIEALLENYEANIVLIEALSCIIESYEDSDDELSWLNLPINPAPAILRVLMDQHNLTVQDFKSEIGNENIVKQVLEGTSELSSESISKLATRFKVKPSLFFRQ